jgi:hypothetical protein
VIVSANNPTVSHIITCITKNDLLCLFSYSYDIQTFFGGGNSTQSVNIFKLQKRIIRIITGTRPKDFCREFFKTLQILALAIQYILFIALFMIHNKDFFLNKFGIT